MIVMTYYYPGYHADPGMYEGLPPSWTEWELLKAARPFFPGHYQPRVPLWGCEDESRSDVMRRKLSTARAYGIDSMVFITSWFNGSLLCGRAAEAAFAVSAAGDGGLAAPSVMWANHTRYLCYPEVPDQDPCPFLQVDYSEGNLRQAIRAFVDGYLSRPGYYSLPDGRLFFSIYSPQDFIRATGTSQRLSWFISALRRELLRSTSRELHVHACNTCYLEDLAVLRLGFDSCSDYLALGYSENVAGKEPHSILPSLRGHLRVSIPLEQRLRTVAATYRRIGAAAPVPYYPVVNVGRDCSPRVSGAAERRIGHYSARPILDEFGPAYFARFLDVAFQYLADAANRNVICFVNAWNEWTEGAYLEPDQVYGTSFLNELLAARRRSD